MPKPKRPPWFKMFLRHKALFEALSDEDAGVAIKAVMDYFESGQIARDVSPAVNVLVCAIKPDIDECADIYATRCENGKLGGRPKRSVRNREEPYGFAGNHMEPCRTEERREKKEERSEVIWRLRRHTLALFLQRSKKSKHTAPHVGTLLTLNASSTSTLPMAGSKGGENPLSTGKRQSERGSVKIMRDKLYHHPGSTTRLRTHGGDAWTRF